MLASRAAKGAARAVVSGRVGVGARRGIFNDAFGQKSLGKLSEGIARRPNKVPATRVHFGHGGQGAAAPTFLRASYDRPIIMGVVGAQLTLGLLTAVVGYKDMLLDVNKND